MARNRILRVRGCVMDVASNRPLPGVPVRVYDKDPIRDDLLGTDATNAEGDFEVCFFERDLKELFDKQPEIYVVLFNGDKERLHRTGTIRLPKDQTQLYFPIAIEAGPLLTEPRISSITPGKVLPGTFVEVHGDNFGDVYQDVTVEIGGREALVLAVRPQELRVRIPPERGDLDPVVVTIAGRTTTASRLLAYATPPRQGTIGTVGAPTTFSGAAAEGAGLSKIRTGQRVLIIMCYPRDKNAGIGGLTPADERQRQVDTFEKLVNPGFRQMSFNRTDFDFDYTEWIELPETDDFYFWRQADVDAAQDALDNLPPDATEAARDEAEAALQVAQDNRNLMKEGLELYHDALQAAQDDGWTLTDYQGVMLCLATDHLRGQASGRWNSVTDSDGDTVNLAPNTNLWVISYTSHWGRRIHELAHAIASGDLYGATGFISDGSLWDMMGNHNMMPLFSGYNMVERLKWYRSEDDVTDPADANMKELEWTSVPEHDELYTLRAHDAVEDNQDNSYHIIKITIFPGLTYYVEVRQEPTTLAPDLDTTSDSPTVLGPAANAAETDTSQLLFDTHVDFPAAEPTHKGGVIVTKVVDDTSNLNQKIRKITLLSPALMQAGEEVVDAARRLTIRVESKTTDRPLTYSIRVKWVAVAVADPAGLFNLRVRPWDSSWQTNDLWVDSEGNSWGTYQTALEPSTGNPTGNGDRPWVEHWNRLYARVHNFGVVPTSDVQVTFYVNSPPAIGDRGTWVPHAVRTIPAIAAGSSEAVYANWFPQVGEHTCLKVAVETQSCETNVDDNDAQENVFDFDTSGASPHQPIDVEVSVQNPLPKWTLIYLHPQGVPVGWEATVEHGWLWLPPLGERKMRVALFTDIGRTAPLSQGMKRRTDNLEIPTEIHFKLEGATYRWYGEGPNTEEQAEHLEATGGIQIKARARRRVELSLNVDEELAEGGRLVAEGRMSTELAGVGVTLKITDPNDRHRVVRLRTDEAGRFVYDSADEGHRVISGLHVLQAFVLSDPVVADVKSEPAKVGVQIPILL